MRLICFWCFLLAAAVRAQNDGFYAPQTYRQVEPVLFQPMGVPWNLKINHDQRSLFSPARNDVIAQSTTVDPWRPAPVNQNWREGSFRYEYASDNGLAAGEIIEPDGSRVGGYQYKDPNGQTVKLKYRAGKDGFQILEGSHLPKSPEPVAPSVGDNHYQQAYHQQQQQYELQQQYNQQRPEPQPWRQNQGADDSQRAVGGQQYTQNWRAPGGPEDDGQYHENDLDGNKPHSFGEGYAFAFKG